MDRVMRNSNSQWQNRKLAVTLLAIMALLVAISVITIMVRN